MDDHNERLLKLANNLSGISYQDWVRLQHLISRMFDVEKKEVEKHLHLPKVSEKDMQRFF